MINSHEHQTNEKKKETNPKSVSRFWLLFFLNRYTVLFDTEANYSSAKQMANFCEFIGHGDPKKLRYDRENSEIHLMR